MRGDRRNNSSSAVLRWLTAVVVLAAAGHGQQIISVGSCPNYQAPAFTQDYIDKLTSPEHEGLILAMTTGGADACQVLKLKSNGKYDYSFVDVANFHRNYTNTFTASPANLTTAAQIRLTTMPGILGAGLRRILVLYPIVANDELLVVASCRSLGVITMEQMMVFVPYKLSSSFSYKDTMAMLTGERVPHINELKNVSRSCDPSVTLANSPLSLRIYNLLTRWTFSNSMTPGDVVNPVPVNAPASLLRNPLRADTFIPPTPGAPYPYVPIEANSFPTRARSDFDVYGASSLDEANQFDGKARTSLSYGVDGSRTETVPLMQGAVPTKDMTLQFTPNFPLFYHTLPVVVPRVVVPVVAGFHPGFHTGQQVVFDNNRPSQVAYYTHGTNNQVFVGSRPGTEQYTMFYPFTV